MMSLQLRASRLRGSAGWVCGLSFLCMLAGAACAGRRPAVDSPAVIAGSVCSGVRGLGPGSLGESPPPPAAQPELLAVLGQPAEDPAGTELALVELDSLRVRWRTPVSASARPEILDDVVMTTTTDGALVALDAGTGAERFRARLDRRYWLGAAQSGRTVVVTTSAGSFDPRQRGSSVIAFDARSGERRWIREVPYAVTRPVVRGDRVLLVADHRDLWTLDLEDGSDTGCGTIGGNSVDWIEARGSQVFLGAREARVLGADARPREATLELPREDLPGRPFVRESSYHPQPAQGSAHGRVAVVAPLHTSETGPVLTPDGFMYVFYRDVFGFDRDGSMTWARLVESDVVRARMSEAGLWLVTEAGELMLLDARTGEPRKRGELDLRVTSADLRVTPRQAPLAAAEAPRPAAGRPPATAALQASLKRVAADTDARLLPARLLAVDELAKLQTDSASADLLDVYTAPNTPEGLKLRIERRMRERTLGADVLLAALDQHEDFLEGRRGPPLRAIVPGLITQHETRAVPALIDHLFDPDTPVEDLGLLVSAIDALGGDRATQPLRRFFQMYRADSALASAPGALVRAAEALLAREDSASRDVLEATRDGRLAPAAVREALATLLAPEPPPPSTPPTDPVQLEPDPEPEAPAPSLRAQLDLARPALEPCLAAAQSRRPKLSAVRLRFVAHPDGKPRDVHVLPDEAGLGECLAAELAELQLVSPEKQLVSHRLVLQPSAAPVAPPPADTGDGDAPFWARAEQRASKTSQPSKAPPWWMDQNPLFVAIDAPPPPTPLLRPREAPRAARAATAAQVEAPATAAPVEAPATAAPVEAPATEAAETSETEDAWWSPVRAE